MRDAVAVRRLAQDDPAAADSYLGPVIRLGLARDHTPYRSRICARLTRSCCGGGPPARYRSTRCAGLAGRRPRRPFTRYQLLLARYSAKLPARPGANGTLIPQDRHVLAWVIYGQPRTPIPGCGGWSLVAFNARTSRGIGFSGWQ